MAGETIRFGVTGVTGFSQRHLEWLERAEAANGPARLAAVALITDDAATAPIAETLRQKGVAVVVGYDEMLALRDTVDLISLPVGIHLHEPLARKALEAGYSVYVEKPVAGSAAEVGSLAAAQAAAPGRLLIGFQTMYQPAMWELKQRLLSGLVGNIRTVVVTVPWSRPHSYFTRNKWAGKIRFHDTLLYDSPLNNAGGHFLNSALFLAGPQLRDAAIPVRAEAELYRVNAIESADNCFVRFHDAAGVEIVFLASLSCPETRGATIDIIGDAGRVIVTDRPERALAPWTEIDTNGNQHEVGADLPRPEVFNCVAQAVADPSYYQVSTLETAGLTTVANQMAFAATTIFDFPAQLLQECSTPSGPLTTIDSIDTILDDLRRNAVLPHQTGRYPWSSPAGIAEGKDVQELLRQAGIALPSTPG